MITRLQRKLIQRLYRHQQSLELERGVVSFTFDDVPASAIEVGAAMLSNADINATFYLAGGLMDGHEQGNPCYTPEMIANLLDNGHEVACHSWSHQPMTRYNKKELIEQWQTNQAFLAEHNVPVDRLNFSYPLGAVGALSKRLAGERFRSARMTEGRINHGQIDLAQLEASKLYSSVIDDAGLKALLQQTADMKGWLILYTHDVSAAPSPWGCTPDLLQAAIDYCRELNLDVRSVDQQLCTMGL